VAHSMVTLSEVIRNKGLEKITVDELVAEITPHGRGKPFRLPMVRARFAAFLTLVPPLQRLSQMTSRPSFSKESGNSCRAHEGAYAPEPGLLCFMVGSCRTGCRAQDFLPARQDLTSAGFV
jgi:hypothetical protein